MKFSGINICAAEPEKLFEWYKGVGFAVDKEDEAGSEWYGSTLKLRDCEDSPLIWIWRKHSDEPQDQIQCQIVIDCDDIQEKYQELKAKGYAVPEPTLQFYGGWEMMLRDAEGNMLLFLG